MHRPSRRSPDQPTFGTLLLRGGVGALCSAAISIARLSASDFIVDTVKDSGPGSLRQGLSEVQSGDRLVFQPILNGKTLDNGQPLLIGAACTFVDANSITLTDPHNFTLPNPTSKTVPAPLTIDWAGTLTLNGILSDGTGAGTVVKNGLGTLVLTNANTFTGGITLNGGTIQVSNSSALGTGALTVTNSVGTGTLDLTGGLTLTNAITLQSKLIVASATGTTDQLGGIISGAAAADQLQVSGGGRLILSGFNTFVGGVQVTDNSSITLQHSSGLGTGTLTATGGMTLDLADGMNVKNKISLGNLFTANVDSGTATLAGTITETAKSQLTKTGTGTLILTGANGYTGGTLISQGVLQGNTTSLLGNITDNAAVIFNQSSAGTYSGNLTGTGTLTKNGSGKLILSGTSSLSGTTNINAGELQVTGSLAGPVNVTASTATLSGTGTVGSVTNAGVVQPGTTNIGTLQVNGDYSQLAGGTTKIKLNDSGNVPGVNNDELKVSGQAKLGGTLNVLVSPGSYSEATKYTILNAAGVTGHFTLASSSNSMYGVNVIYGPTDVMFQLKQTTSLFDAAETPNQAAVGTALDNLALTSSGALYSMINTLGIQSPEQQRQAMNQLSGEVFGNLQTIGLQIGDQFQQKVASMLVSNGSFLAGGERILSSNVDVRGQSPDPTQSGSLARGWIQGFGVGGNIRSDGNGAAVNYNQGGGLLGIDIGEDETGYIGVAGGSSYVHFHDSFDAGGQVASYQVGSYAMKHDEISYVLGTVNYGYNAYITDRNVLVSGVNQAIHANFAGNQIGASAETGLKFSAGPIHVQPLIGLQYLYLCQQGFEESGGPAALVVDRSRANALRANVGARLALDPWMGPRGAVWTPYSQARFVSDLLDNDRIINATFVGAPPGGAFATQGTRIGPNYGVFGGGLEVRIDEHWSLFGTGDATVGDHITIATGSVGSVSRW